MDPQAPAVEERQEHIAMALAAVAGFIDAYGIVRYGTYLSFMSGNTTQTGYHIGLGDFSSVPLFATGIAAFLVGSFVGAYFGHPFGRLTRRLTLLAIAIMIALIMVLALSGSTATLLSIALLSFAMGAMNASLPNVGAQSVNLTFVTGTLRRLGTHLALAVRARRCPTAKAPGTRISGARSCWPASGPAFSSARRSRAW